MVEEIKKKLHLEVDKYKAVQKDYRKIIAQREKLEGQLSENTAVKEELDLLKPNEAVFKLLGPVLMKQDLEEAKQNVAKRIHYISTELKRVDDTIMELGKKQDTHREAIAKLEQQFQRA